MQDWIVPAAAGVLALVALGLGLALLRARSRTDRELTASRAETAALRAQLDELERRVDAPERRRAPDAEYVITDLGDRAPGFDPKFDPASSEREPTPYVGGALFADLVLRETVVKAASLAHGVRRALDPEARNRIRFEMRREVKRARKQRRADTREARREWAARQRAAVDQDPAKDPAA